MTDGPILEFDHEDFDEDDWEEWERSNEIVFLNFLFEGAASIDQLAQLLRGFAEHLEERARQGWRLCDPVSGGYAHLVLGAAS